MENSVQDDARTEKIVLILIIMEDTHGESRHISP